MLAYLYHVCEGYEVSWEDDANSVTCLHTLCHSDVIDQVLYYILFALFCYGTSCFVVKFCIASSR